MISTTKVAAFLNWFASALHTIEQGVNCLAEKVVRRNVEAAARKVNVAEAKLGEAEDKLLDLEDSYHETRAKLRDRFEAALEALRKSYEGAREEQQERIATAAYAVTKAECNFDAELDGAYEFLGVDLEGEDAAA